MPMLADIDDPPRSRLPGIAIGLLVALPFVGVLMVWFIPMLVHAVLGGAAGIDDRLALEDQYMKSVCSTALDVDRDERLCACALGTDYPALDCQAAFLVWSLERQSEYCIEPANKKASLSFCTCVETVAAVTLEATDNEASLREAQAYRNCQALPDAVHLPTLEALAPAVAE